MTWYLTHYTCSQEPEAEYLPTSYSDTESLEPLKSTNTQDKFCSTDKLTDRYLNSLFGTTREHSESTIQTRRNTLNGCEESKKTYVFQAAPLVKTYRLRVNGRGSTAQNQFFGKSLPESLGKFDRDTSSWKTPTSLFGEDLMLLSQTLPHWGILLRGELYQREMWARRTYGRGFGVSEYPTACATGVGGTGAYKKWKKVQEKIPTPKATDWKQQGKEAALRRDSLDLPSYAIIFPTPMAHDAKQSVPENIRENHFFDLTRFVAKYPTPMTNGFGGCSGTRKKVKRSKDLTEEEKRSFVAGNGGKLNPDWVEWLMGFPIGWTRTN